MGYSAFDPVALADIRSVKNKIDVSGITSDVLAVGDVIRYDPESDTYMRAQANNDVNANFIGVIESIDGNWSASLANAIKSPAADPPMVPMSKDVSVLSLNWSRTFIQSLAASSERGVTNDVRVERGWNM